MDLMPTRRSPRARPRTRSQPVPASAALLVLVLLVLLGLAVGCSGGDDSAPDGPDDESAATDPDDDGSGSNADGDYEQADDDTPLGINPEAVVGTLDNGLTYYLLENDSPGGSLELRLVVGAGSLQAEPESGTAHFLEHMLFNGTASFPGTDLDRTLQGLGIELGADSNAYTTHDSTVYLLRAPTRDPEALTTAFRVLAEWASAATIDPAEVEAEIGVVRDEFRQSRESPGGFIVAEFDRVYTDGTPYAERSVLGSAEAIAATDADILRSFYDRWYRPDNMAVVAVGDLGVDRLEELVSEHFDDLEARGDDHPAPPVLDISPNPEATAFHVTHPGNLFDNLSIDFQLRNWDPSTVGGARLGVWETLIATMVSDRLSDAYHAGELAVDFETDLQVFSIASGLHYFGSNLAGPDLGAALRQYLGVVRGAAEGFDDDELAAAVETYEAGLDFAADTVRTLQDYDYADAFAAHFLEGHSIEAPLEAIRRQRAVLEAVSADGLAEHLASILDSSGALLIAVGSDEATLPSPAELLEITADAEATPRTEPADEIDSLLAAPEPAEIAAGGVLDISTRPRWWSFANGATVVFEESGIAEGTVLITAQSPGGFSRHDAQGPVITRLATDAVGASGLAGLTRGQIDGYLADKTADIAPFVFRDFDVLSGGSSSEDIETAMQLLHLLVTEPRIDAAGLNNARSIGEAVMAAYESRAETRADIEYRRLLYGGDFGNWIPSSESLTEADAESLLQTYLQHFGSADGLVVSIVGDADASEVERLARSYVGTLPAGEAGTVVDRLPEPPAEVLSAQVALRPGEADGGITMTWRLRERWDTADAATAVVLESIVNSRIFEKIREELGASYSGEAVVSALELPHSHLLAEIVIDGDPARLDEIRSALLGELADLASEGPSVAELARALAVVGENFNYIDNETLSAQNLALAFNPESPILTVDNRMRALAGVSGRQVASLAADLFDLDAYIEVSRTAGDTAG